MSKLARLIKWHDTLVEARSNGVREFRDQNSETIIYKGDSEMAGAIAALDSEIAATRQQATHHPFQNLERTLTVKSYVQRGDRLTILAPAAVTGGSPVIVGELFGVAFGDAAIGEDLDLALVGVFTLSKVEADTFAIGDAVHLDITTGLVTSDDDEGDNRRIGIAGESAADPSANATVRLDG